MVKTLVAEPLEAGSFAPFGQVLETSGEADMLINAGRCGRFHDLAEISIERGHAGISLFQSELARLPYTFDMVERHPRGSQAFVPMCQGAYLVVVAPDEDGTPGDPLAFLAGPGQGVNIGKGIWHGVLTPVAGSGLFAVIDRVGRGSNLEEHTYDTGFTVMAP